MSTYYGLSYGDKTGLSYGDKTLKGLYRFEGKVQNLVLRAKGMEESFVICHCGFHGSSTFT